MSWMGVLWHKAPQPALAEAIAQLPDLLGAIHPLFAVHRFELGSSFRGPEQVLSEDFSVPALLEVLRVQHAVGVFSGTRFRGPDLELNFCIRIFEHPEERGERYRPQEREHPGHAMGGVSFHVHSDQVEEGHVRAAFRCVARCLERHLVCGSLFSRSLHEALQERVLAEPRIRAPISSGGLQVLG